MRGMLALILIVVNLGIIDVLEGNIARVELVESELTIMRDVELSKIPCQVREGDMVIVIDIDKDSVYKCVPSSVYRKTLINHGYIPK